MEMIKPMVKLKMNQCPNCISGRLELVEEETYVGALNSTGVPIGGQSFINIILRCNNCKKKYPAIKKGVHYIIAPLNDNQSKVIINDYNPFYQ